MNIEEVKSYYSQIIDKQGDMLSSLKRTIFRVGTVRLVIVIACVTAVYLHWGDSYLVTSVIAISIIGFLALMKYHSKLFKSKRYCEQQIENAKNELKGLEYDFSAFDGAPEKTDSEHSFSLDLDLFGQRSFFQSINRTVTSFGKDCLANMLIHPLDNKNDILVRQDSILELGRKKDLLSHFRAIGQTSETDSLNKKDFSESFAFPSLLSQNKFWLILTYLIPLIYVVCVVFVYLDILSGYCFLPLYLITLFVSGLPSKRVNLIMGTFDNKSKVLQAYSELFKVIESRKFDSNYLQDIQTKLNKPQKASKAIAELGSLHTKLIMSADYPILLLINPVFFWNVRYAIKIERWSQKYKDNIETWFNSIALFDALVSWGIFAFNHPDYSYPEPKDNFVFRGKALGHPMLRRDVCVRNDIDIAKTSFFLVITGANMAGKSTYLRTVGINHTLACAGAPVCAASLEFYPGNLVTNLRTVDSLADNESYFFAELKRLKMIIDRLEAGEELFIVLDEILKGTNSIDKQKGSLALMKQLISLRGNGIIATHDLLLGDLQNEYPDNVKNYCFEADITDNHLTFTYKMREGIAQNMNASFLMKQMGITGL